MVAAATGVPAVDALRGVLLKLLGEKDGVRKADVAAAAGATGV